MELSKLYSITSTQPLEVLASLRQERRRVRHDCSVVFRSAEIKRRLVPILVLSKETRHG